jgi:tRNA (adenine57-N1/adenine58-N1)-methyltransferase
LNNETISEGDDVLLYLDSRRTYLIKLKIGERFHTHRGFIELDEVAGKRYGDSVITSLGVNFYLIKPGLYDYIRKMRYTTQIIYPKDIGVIIVHSGIGPGSKVVEAGTGSGALASALAYYVKPTGKVYSYEIRPETLEKAQKNIERSGVLDFIELKNKDVTEEIEEEEVDSVILDIATPWLAVPNAYNALKGNGTLVSFSPSINQVEKTVKTLESHGFIDIETVECFIRRMKVKEGETRPETLMRGHSGYITWGRKIFL